MSSPVSDRQPDHLGGFGLVSEVAAESGPQLGEIQVKARGYWEQVWIRFRRDKVAITGGLFIFFLFFVAYFMDRSPLTSSGMVRTTSSGPGRSGDLQTGGPWTRVSAAPYSVPGGIRLHPLHPRRRRCHRSRLYSRLLYGAQVSLEVAVGATAIGMVIGVTMGAIGGYFGGWVDTVVSRLTEIVMAFPYLLFVIALASTVGTGSTMYARLPREGGPDARPRPGAVLVVLSRAHHQSPGPVAAREGVHRGRAHGRRERRAHHPLSSPAAPGRADHRLLDAGRCGEHPRRGRALVPFSWDASCHAELGQPARGVGPKFYTTQPWLMVWPGMAVLLTTLAFNLLGDGLRDAVDPRSVRADNEL